MLGSSGPKRSAMLPDVPTIAETIPGHAIETWNGLLVPAGTSQAVVEALGREMINAHKSPEYRERPLKLGVDPVSSPRPSSHDWLPPTPSAGAARPGTRPRSGAVSLVSGTVGPYVGRTACRRACKCQRSRRGSGAWRLHWSLVAAEHGRLRTCCGKDLSETPGLQRRRLGVRLGEIVPHNARALALRGHAADQQVGAGGRARDGDARAGCPVERIEARDFAEGGRVAMLVRAMKVERRTVVQGRAAGEYFHRAGIRKLANDYPFGAAERSCEPARPERNAALVAVAEWLERGGVDQLAWPGRMHASVADAVAAAVFIGFSSEKANTFTSAGTPGPGAVTML